MEKFPLSGIKEPSDLFRKEILPECTFESKYGKLTMKSIVVPDFSNDEKGLHRLKEEFDNIKSFITEKDLNKKGEIACLLWDNEFSTTDGVTSPKCIYGSQIFSSFIGQLWARGIVELLENGKTVNMKVLSLVCLNFSDTYSRFWISSMEYMNCSISSKLLRCAGVYLYCLGCFLSHRQLSTIPYRFLEVYKRIPSSEFPVDNRIAWSIFIGKTNKELLHFCDKYFPIVLSEK